MGKTLLVLLHAVWEDPCNAAEVLAIGDGDTLTVTEGSRRESSAALPAYTLQRPHSPRKALHNSTTSNKGSVSGWF